MLVDWYHIWYRGSSRADIFVDQFRGIDFVGG